MTTVPTTYTLGATMTETFTAEDRDFYDTLLDSIPTDVDYIDPRDLA